MNPTRKNKNNKNKKTKKVSEKKLELRLIRSYPKQAVWQVWLPVTPQKFTTTVTTGLIAGSIGTNIGFVQSFATRFGSTFVEYRIIKAVFRIRFFSSTNPGIVQFWLDEKSTGTPTLNEALERATVTSNASAIDRIPELRWVCADPLDLQYTAIGTTVTTLTFKVYSNNANFGSSIAASDYLEVIPEFCFQFRGLQGV